MMGMLMKDHKDELDGKLARELRCSRLWVPSSRTSSSFGRRVFVDDTRPRGAGRGPVAG